MVKKMLKLKLQYFYMSNIQSLWTMTKGQGQIITMEIRYPNTPNITSDTSLNILAKSQTVTWKTQHTMTEGTGQHNLQIRFLIGNHTSSYLKKKK